MNDLTIQNTTSNSNSTALAMPPAKNAFEAYSESVNSNRIVGALLKFNKGDWLVGQDNDELKLGTTLVAAVEEVMVGYLKWEDSKVVDMRMGKVKDGFVMPARRDLGDVDQGSWDTDDQGKPRDPWQMTSYLILKAADGQDLYTYAPSSAGGRNVVAALCGEYGKHSRQKPDEFPIVELAVDSYMHKVKSYGRIKVPVLQIVGWISKAATMAAIVGEAADAEADRKAEKEQEETPTTPAKGGKGTKAASTAETRF
jgi:hypothetical protein